ncbi:MAG: NirF protein, partial [Planctomycetota bacterium]
SVVVLNRNLEKIKEIPTQSRNVGIKIWKDKLVFSLMDKDEIWVLQNHKPFSVIKKFKKIGKMPFDALLTAGIYVAGCFKSSHLAVVNLDTLKLRKIYLQNREKKPLFKIPHFGTWGVAEKVIYVPGTGVSKVYEVSLENFQILREIPLLGFPVFARLDPKQKYLVVNYSGNQEDYLSVIHLKSLKRRDWKSGERILHFGFARQGKVLILSSYYENLVKAFSFPEGKKLYSVPIPTPSGIFILEEQKKIEKKRKKG